MRKSKCQLLTNADLFRYSKKFFQALMLIHIFFKYSLKVCLIYFKINASDKDIYKKNMMLFDLPVVDLRCFNAHNKKRDMHFLIWDSIIWPRTEIAAEERKHVYKPLSRSTKFRNFDCCFYDMELTLKKKMLFNFKNCKIPMNENIQNFFLSHTWFQKAFLIFRSLENQYVLKI